MLSSEPKEGWLVMWRLTENAFNRNLSRWMTTSRFGGLIWSRSLGNIFSIMNFVESIKRHNCSLDASLPRGSSLGYRRSSIFLFSMSHKDWQLRERPPHRELWGIMHSSKKKNLNTSGLSHSCNLLLAQKRVEKNWSLKQERRTSLCSAKDV